MNKLSKIKSITVFIAGVSAASMPAIATADWSFVGLGTLGGIEDIPSSAAFDINDYGQVTGVSFIGGKYHAFITGPNGVGMTDLGTLDGTSTYGIGINNSGQVAGSGDNRHAFITGPNGVGMTDLGTLGGSGSYSVAQGINNSGQVVGHYQKPDSSYHAFITGPNGVGLTDLGIGGIFSDALGINDSGQVVGHSSNAFLYSNGGITELSWLPIVMAAGWTDLIPRAINNNGQIVG